MALSHTNCTHPSTSSARAACRKAGAASAEPMTRFETDAPSTEAIAHMARPKKTRAKRETEASVTAEKAIKRAKANAVRTAVTQAQNPRKERGACYVCGSPAAHAERKSGNAVCMKHIDNWDDIKILAL